MCVVKERRWGRREKCEITRSVPIILTRYCRACKDFEQMIVKCTLYLGGPRTSFKDWARLQYKGSDIIEFKILIGSCKSIITIVLMNANLYRFTHLS